MKQISFLVMLIVMFCSCPLSANAAWFQRKKAETPEEVKAEPQGKEVKPPEEMETVPAASPAEPARGRVADEEPGSAEEAAPKLTKEMMLKRVSVIKYRIDIREAIPEAEVIGEGDDAVVKYNDTLIEDLDEDTLMQLLQRVNQQVNLKNVQNLQKLQRMQQQERQRKQMRQFERMNRRHRQERQERQRRQQQRLLRK